ncbi:GATA zinc finger domain-containing protein 10-like [Pararge aegeria]|uniref:Jg8511 protein n=1 Tax=Pararge aegeria aegeria TaxID=348720 RepID=A0A8S4RAJ9_9NEOP|nr:GATA zinc finger domain-containing protein 10-like [Pararge aegeria]CAH2233575.1 jg8511 [Pararge aegeria aegeria]
MYSSILILSFIVVGNLSLCDANFERNFKPPLNSNKIPDDVNNINIGNAGRNRRPNDYTTRGQSQTGTLTNKFGEDITYTSSQNPGPNREELPSPNPTSYNAYLKQLQEQQREKQRLEQKRQQQQQQLEQQQLLEHQQLEQQREQQQWREKQQQAQRQIPNYAERQPSAWMLEQQAANELLLRRLLNLSEQLQEIVTQLIQNQNLP